MDTVRALLRKLGVLSRLGRNIRFRDSLFAHRVYNNRSRMSIHCVVSGDTYAYTKLRRRQGIGKMNMRITFQRTAIFYYLPMPQD